jgi:hypothetical protein
MRKLSLAFLVLLLFLTACGGEKYTVSFYSDGEKLFPDIEVGGEPVNLPLPQMEGREFLGWHDEAGRKYDDNSIFTGNTTLYAQWAKKIFAVKFLDYDDSVIEAMEVEYGTGIDNPPVAEREGYEFIGWDQPLDKITGDLIVRARYQKRAYTVVFVDWEGQVLAEATVLHGEAALSPEPPERAGYVFLGWDKNFENITSDIVIAPVYERIDFKTEYADGGYYIGAYYGDEETVVIPNELDGIPVIGISAGAFQDNLRIKNVVFPASLKEIAERAFYNCRSLTKIEFPEGLEVIGAEAFADCWALTEAVFPATLSHIGDLAFYNCDLIAEIVLPASLKTMGAGVFENCTRVERAEIHAEIIGVQAFSGCSMLKELIIGDEVRKINPHAFFACSSLVEVYIPPSVIAIGDHVFSWCGKLQSVRTDLDNLENLRSIFEQITLIYANFEIEPRD